MTPPRSVGPASASAAERRTEAIDAEEARLLGGLRQLTKADAARRLGVHESRLTDVWVHIPGSWRSEGGRYLCTARGLNEFVESGAFARLMDQDTQTPRESSAASVAG